AKRHSFHAISCQVAVMPGICRCPLPLMFVETKMQHEQTLQVLSGKSDLKSFRVSHLDCEKFTRVILFSRGTLKAVSRVIAAEFSAASRVGCAKPPSEFQFLMIDFPQFFRLTR